MPGHSKVMKKKILQLEVITLALLLLLFGSVNFLVHASETVHPVISCFYTKEKVVALTSDDGPDPRYTPVVLKILKEHNAKATFFVVGSSLEKYPELARAYLAEGHELANHTFSHAHLESLTPSQIKGEITKNDEVIESLTGQKVKWFRPPRKRYTKDVLEIAYQEGLQTALWTVCLENRQASTPEEMAQRVLKRVRPGAIILFHEGILDRQKTMEALPLVLEGLEKKGYRMVTLSELLEHEKSVKVFRNKTRKKEYKIAGIANTIPEYFIKFTLRRGIENGATPGGFGLYSIY